MQSEESIEKTSEGFSLDTDAIRDLQADFNYAQLSRMREFNSELDRLMREQFYSSKTPEEFLIEATKTAAETLRVQRASIWTYTENKSAIRCECLFDGEHQPDSVGMALKENDFPAYFKAISQSRVVTAGEARTDPQTLEFTDSYLVPLDIHSLLDAHVPSATGVRGVLCCESVGEAREWAMDEMSFVASLAELVGMALERVEREHTHEQLAQALRAAERAGEAKSAFLANMSHEIRTPMNGILGMLELILLNEQDPHKREQLEIANNSARSLLNVLDDVLDYSRLEADEFTITPEPYAIKQMVQEVVSLFGSRAKAKDISMLTHIDESVPDTLIGDQIRVRQILNNFVSNALKFTDKGSITVSLVKEVLDNTDYLRLSVQDSGIGIPEEDLPKLFQRFSQVDNSSTRKQGGTGLGLVICKQLVGLMNGDIGVESKLGNGSEFWIRLPMTTADSEILELPKTPKICPSGEETPCLKVLAAEDNMVNQKVLDAMIRSLGHEIMTVSNGQEALDALDNAEFDVILMDIQMPVMDGLSATSAIRSRRSPDRDIVIIALTANAMVGDRERYLAAGMNDYVAKPFQRRDLCDALNRAAEKYVVDPS